MDTLPPQLTSDQLQSVAGQLASQKASQSTIQGFVNNYQKASDGTYTLKPNSQVQQFQQQQGSFAQEKQNVAGQGVKGAVTGAFSGAPLAPATQDDVNPKTVGGTLKDFGEGLGRAALNLISDTPAFLKGLGQAIGTPILDTVTGHPIDAVESIVGTTKNIVGYYSNIVGTALSDIKTTIETGNTDQAKADIQKMLISMEDHPLQAFAGLEGGSDIVSGGANFYNKLTTNSLTDAMDNIRESATAKTDALNKANDLKSSADALRAKTQVAVDASAEQLKNKQAEVTEKQGQVQGVTDQLKQAKIDQAKADLDQSQKDLEAMQAKRDADAATAAHTAKLNDATTDQNGEMSQKSKFPSLTALTEGVKTFGKIIKSNLDNLFENTRTSANATIKDASSIFSGFDKLKSYLTRIGDTETINGLGPKIDVLKVRDALQKYTAGGKSLDDLFTDLRKANGDPVKLKELGLEGLSDIDPKALNNLYNMTPDQLKTLFPPIKTADISGLLSNITKKISDTNTDALGQFSQLVKTEFGKAADDAIKDQFGQDTLNKIKELKANWSKMLSSDIVQKVLKGENLTLKDIKDGWSDFSKFASTFPEGKALMTQIQNFVGSEILSNAFKNGEYDVASLKSSLKTYGDVLGSDIKSRIEDLTKLHEDNNASIENQKQIDQSQKQEKAISTKAQNIEQDITETQLKTKEAELKQQATAAETDAQTLKDNQKKLEEDAQVIGKTPAEVIKNLRGITTVDDWNNFVEKSGMSEQEVRDVLTSSLVQASDAEFGKSPTAQFGLANLKGLIKSVENLGGDDSNPEKEAVQKQMLGEDGYNKFIELKNQMEQYETLKGIKSRTLGSRIIKAAFGTFLITIGMGRFFGARQIMDALRTTSIDTTSDVADRGTKIKPKTTASEVIKKVINKVTPTLPAVGVANEKDNQEN